MSREGNQSRMRRIIFNQSLLPLPPSRDDPGSLRHDLPDFAVRPFQGAARVGKHVKFAVRVLTEGDDELLERATRMARHIQRLHGPFTVGTFARDVEHAIRKHEVARPIAEDVFADKLGKCFAAINVSTRDANAFRVRVLSEFAKILVRQNRIDQWLAVRTDLWAIVRRIARLLRIEVAETFANIPTVIAAFGNDVEFLP